MQAPSFSHVITGTVIVLVWYLNPSSWEEILESKCTVDSDHLWSLMILTILKIWSYPHWEEVWSYVLFCMCTYMRIHITIKQAGRYGVFPFIYTYVCVIRFDCYQEWFRWMTHTSLGLGESVTPLIRYIHRADALCTHNAATDNWKHSFTCSSHLWYCTILNVS